MPGLMLAPYAMASHTSGIRQGLSALPSVFQPRQRSGEFSLAARDETEPQIVGRIGIMGAIVGGLTGAAALRATLGRKRSRLPFKTGGRTSCIEIPKSKVQSPTGRQDSTNPTMVMTPVGTCEALANEGKKISEMSTVRTFYASVMGGCYVGMAGLLSLAMAGNLGPGTAPSVEKFVFAALFPAHLLLALQSGCQLFVGNAATMALAFFEGHVKKCDVLRNWIVSYCGNAVGCSMLALVAWYTGLLTIGTQELAIKTVLEKCSDSFGQTLVKGILCNWLVCLAVFLSTSASDLSGKMVGIWFPISMFVALGFEHSVANMFILPAGLIGGAPLSTTDVLTRNLIPATIGNIIAGVLFAIGAGFTYSVGKWSKE
eukprot:TRINITY_DN8487_c0_g1_i2.p1 TRINITY_DN8487_c0_g1~~TRINITY_DN8487_c0_g1_i2.p1  ORF type:complete len:372 (-),score=53.54 TRINITY_DN8487_c0_g1_i2:830-1945(-)